jgi:hypothetical protein
MMEEMERFEHSLEPSRVTPFKILKGKKSTEAGCYKNTNRLSSQREEVI